MKNDYSLARELSPESRAKLAENPPQLTPVESSQIESIGYDVARGILFIKFIQTQTTYVYLEVPSDVYDRFLAAESKGRFMNQEIRNKFLYAKL